MKHRGLTLLELIVTLAVLAITLVVAIPGFSEQVKKSHTKNAMLSLLEAIETARSTAVYRNKRTMLIATEKKWSKGWELFVDLNDDGVRNGREVVIVKMTPLSGVRITTTKNNPLREYVSFIGTGEGRKPGKANSGAFLAGTLNVCPQTPGDGYALVLARGGRTRVKNLSPAECKNLDK